MCMLSILSTLLLDLIDSEATFQISRKVYGIKRSGHVVTRMLYNMIKPYFEEINLEEEEGLNKWKGSAAETFLKIDLSDSTLPAWTMKPTSLQATHQEYLQFDAKTFRNQYYALK